MGNCYWSGFTILTIILSCFKVWIIYTKSFVFEAPATQWVEYIK